MIKLLIKCKSEHLRQRARDKQGQTTSFQMQFLFPCQRFSARFWDFGFFLFVTTFSGEFHPPFGRILTGLSSARLHDATN